jgi:hypothetical protein
VLINESQRLDGKPGIHLFIVGISKYMYLPAQGAPSTETTLGLHQLSSPALTAYSIYQWLREHSRSLVLPISTAQLLLAPSELELQAEPALADYATRCTLTEFLKAADSWRSFAAAHPDGMALFYFAGHGLQKIRKDKDHVLLMGDFGDGIGTRLRNAVRTSSLYNGMAPTGVHPNIARRQLYFIDACRMPPLYSSNLELEPAQSVFDAAKLTDEESDEVVVDDRDAPLFHTTLPGAESFGLNGQQSLFSQALITCLDGGTGTLVRQGSNGKDTWVISDQSLQVGVPYHLRRLANSVHRLQDCHSQWHGKPFSILTLASPPTVEVCCQIEPSHIAPYTRVNIRNGWNGAVCMKFVVKPHPKTISLPGGRYNVRAISASRTPSWEMRDIFNANLPGEDWVFSLT